MIFNNKLKQKKNDCHHCSYFRIGCTKYVLGKFEWHDEEEQYKYETVTMVRGENVYGFPVKDRWGPEFFIILQIDRKPVIESDTYYFSCVLHVSKLLKQKAQFSSNEIDWYRMTM